ncbi:MAG: flagellar basal body rod protein FlgC [Acidobacteriota bacterium]|nr:flagellar basal body rod protein FlgC [Acidobacteriota bacterium]
MNLFGVLDISASALTAERVRAEVVASNLANAETTSTPGGGPYQKQLVVFETEQPGQGKFAQTLSRFGDLHARGVKVEKVVADKAPAVRRYEPGHPDADADGYVSFPNINPVEEMVNLMGAAQAYQLNVAAVQATKGMISETLQILT